MPNGKPGDHPLTDVLVHDLEVYGPRVDALIREIARLGGRSLLEEEVDLVRADPRFRPRGEPPAELAILERRLGNLRDQLLTASPSD